MSKIDDIAADLTQTSADLAAIKTGIANLSGPLQAQIADLQAQVAALVAGDVLTESQLDALVTSAEAVKTSADEVLAVVTPPAV